MSLNINSLGPRAQRQALEQIAKWEKAPHELKANKFAAKPTEYNGVRYASRAEAGRAAELDALVNAGMVLWWIGQVKFRLGVAENVYVTDFVVAIRNDSGHLEVHAEDVKGLRTPKFDRDLKLWARYGRMPLWIMKRKGINWEKEIVSPSLI